MSASSVASVFLPDDADFRWETAVDLIRQEFPDATVESRSTGLASEKEPYVLATFPDGYELNFSLEDGKESAAETLDRYELPPEVAADLRRAVSTCSRMVVVRDDTDTGGDCYEDHFNDFFCGAYHVFTHVPGSFVIDDSAIEEAPYKSDSAPTSDEQQPAALQVTPPAPAVSPSTGAVEVSTKPWWKRLLD